MNLWLDAESGNKKRSGVEEEFVDVDLLDLALDGGAVVGAHDGLLLLRLARDGDELDCRLVLVGDQFHGAAAALLHQDLGHVDLVVGVGEVGVLEGFGGGDAEFGLLLQHLAEQVALCVGGGVPFWLSLSKSGPVSTMSHSLFMAMISCAFLPMKRCLLKMM